MKEIGEKLKETREAMGVSIEEASEDLNVRPSQIEAAESGNIKAFKDIFSLKFFIRDYSKYLGLNYDEMIDEFNEYLFDYTSKLSLEDIKKAANADKKEKLKGKKISSPYTSSDNRKFIIPPIIIYILVIGILAICGYFVYDGLSDHNDNNVKTGNIIE